MKQWIRAIDEILRGDATRLSKIRDGTLDVPAAGLTVLIVLFGAIHGFCMGWLALFARDDPAFTQMIASMIKVPTLFLLTLVVTFPSLYVFNALVGSRFGMVTVLRLLIAAMALTVTVLASFGPIVAFFSLTTTSYPFMVLLNVLFFAVAGVLGLMFLLQTLHRLTLSDASSATPIVGESSSATESSHQEPPGALDSPPGSILGRNVKLVFAIWLVVFGLVGAQMSWVLRPFIGNPAQEFTWFRARESNFFDAVIRAMTSMF